QNVGDTCEHRFQDLQLNWNIMDGTRVNYAFRRIYSCRPVIGNVIVFFKRVVRKCLKWYLEPVCFQQTDFNNATTWAVDRLRELQQDALTKIEQVKTSGHQELERVQLLQQTHHQQLTALETAQNAENARMNQHLTALETAQNAENARMDQQLAALETAKNAESSQMNQQLRQLAQQLSQMNQQLTQLHEQGAFADIVKNESTIRRSASQSGEDGILSHVLRALSIPENTCTYLDLGANHAKYLSNTYYFYQMGARGVLVEANPALIGELKLYRQGDVILNRCIDETSGKTVPFYVLSGDGLSTPSLADAEEALCQNPNIQITQTVQVETISINEILEQYFDKAPLFLNIDIEGKEMDILNSIDFTAHRPLAISVEMIPYRHHLVFGEKRTDILEFMEQNGYFEYAFSGINSIFLDKKQLAEVYV
ncbi:MAG: FkbM family methyltransferase, partial [Oscillospiraceae bacterium]